MQAAQGAPEEALAVMHRLNAERLETTLCTAQPVSGEHRQIFCLLDQQAPSDTHTTPAGPDAELPAAVVCALFEVLGFDELLEDAGVLGSLEGALLRLAPAHELDLASGGRYPGLYRLLGHHSADLRAMVRLLLCLSQDLHCCSHAACA